MPIPVYMPALSPTMKDGHLVKWHKKEGDALEAGEILAEIETDKATMEVEVIDEGILGKIIIPEGTQNVPVNEIIAVILEEGEDEKELESYLKSTVKDSFEVTKEQKADPVDQKKEEEKQPEERIFVTPLAKKFAENNSVSLKGIKGSGPKGRIIKLDIENFLKNTSQKPCAIPSHIHYEDLSISNKRQIIATKLSEAKQTIPHYYLTIECVLDELIDLRKKLNNSPKTKVKISINDFIVRASALSLIDEPEVNCSWRCDAIRCYKSADVAVAVSIDDGLITPIVKDADRKPLEDISKEVKELAEKARSGKLKLDEIQGGSFTISNLGMYGIKSFSAIINPPQACILAVGVCEKRPWVKDDKLTIANVLSCTLSADHRAIDGANAARFLQRIRFYLENPLELIL
ncbi:MAG: pyruvate dehydrogenase complex dihydrolipoamide acetyltransferase [Alphaproteobacteria bacterium]